MNNLLSITKQTLKALILLILFAQCSNNANSQQDRPPQNQRYIKLALLLDTSNSMDGLIDQAKSQLWNIVNELAKAKCDGEHPELQIALYEYGNDNLPMSEGYVRMVTPLTSDLDQISSDLFSLTTNGGDEYCGTVINRCMRQLEWSSSAKELQLIFIAGNEPFTQGKLSYVSACNDAKSKNVVVNTIYCGDFTEGISTSWKKGADITGGKYFSIEQDRKTVFIPSPYDDRITELNEKLNETYIAYGAAGKQKVANQKAQDKNSYRYGKANAVKRTVSKSSHVYKNQSWDLVDASKEKDFEIEKVQEEELPEEMKKMDISERKAYVEKKNTERESIKKEIQDLNKKRLAYIATQQSSNEDEQMLDKAILKAVKTQAQSKNFIIE